MNCAQVKLPHQSSILLIKQIRDIEYEIAKKSDKLTLHFNKWDISSV